MLSAETRRRLSGKTVIASVSGGKDSAALSLWLHENGITHERVFLDTGWEHPATYEYIRGPLAKAIGPITEVRSVGMEALVRQKSMFPSRLRRTCTEALKVKPMRAFLDERVDDFVNAVGIRAQESRARSSLAEWEWSEALDCFTWRPLIKWTTEDVVAIHKRHALEPNPLYLMGAMRVGCWPCIFARKSEVLLVAVTDPARIDRLRVLEQEITDAARTRDAAAVRTFFPERSPGEPRGIDAQVAWARSDRGRGVPHIGENARDGCMRWGLCSTEEEE